MDDVAYIDPETICGTNLFAYCNNNPVMNVDPSGTKWYDPRTWDWNKAKDWTEDHLTEIAVGTAFIVGGAIVTALTCGLGTTAWAAFGSALLSSAVQVGTSVAIGIGVNGLKNVYHGKSFFDDVGNTIANSYMWGGIFSGGAQIIGGGFRMAANRGVTTGRKGGIKLGNSNVKIFSPDKNNWAKAGGTLVKFGNVVRFDTGAMWGLHMHILGSSGHIPVGSIIAGLLATEH